MMWVKSGSTYFTFGRSKYTVWLVFELADFSSLFSGDFDSFKKSNLAFVRSKFLSTLKTTNIHQMTDKVFVINNVTKQLCYEDFASMEYYRRLSRDLKSL